MQELEKLLPIMQSLGVEGIRRLTTVGGSYALILPKAWVDVCALSAGKRKWIRMIPTADGSIKVSELTEDEVRAWSVGLD